MARLCRRRSSPRASLRLASWPRSLPPSSSTPCRSTARPSSSPVWEWTFRATSCPGGPWPWPRRWNRSMSCSMRRSAPATSINMDETTLQVLKEPTTQHLDVVPVAFPWRQSRPADRGLSLRPVQVGLCPQGLSGRVRGLHPDRRLRRVSGPRGIGRHHHVGCMALIRRKFMDVQKATSKKVVHGTAKEILDLIGLLYKVEQNIKELSLDEKIEKRREQAVPILDAIRASSMTASITFHPRACSGRP